MIYIHVGTPKTGTTAIQKHLTQNRLNLLNMGYLYPQTGIQHWGHHNIYYELSSNPKYAASLGSFDQLRRNLSAFKEKRPDNNIILSSETFCTMHSALFAKLIDGFSLIDKYTVIIYLRAQADFLKSFWSLHVSNGLTNYGFEQWASENIETNMASTDYLENINELSAVIGDASIKVKIYEEVKQEDFVNDFLENCGFENLDGITSLENKLHNVSAHKTIPMPDSIKQLCKDRFKDSNSVIARRFLDRDYLFESMV